MNFRKRSFSELYCNRMSLETWTLNSTYVNVINIKWLFEFQRRSPVSWMKVEAGPVLEWSRRLGDFHGRWNRSSKRTSQGDAWTSRKTGRRCTGALTRVYDILYSNSGELSHPSSRDDIYRRIPDHLADDAKANVNVAFESQLDVTV